MSVGNVNHAAGRNREGNTQSGAELIPGFGILISIFRWLSGKPEVSASKAWKIEFLCYLMSFSRYFSSGFPQIVINESSGSMRGMYGDDLPIVRMTNINLSPGDWSRDEIINETKNGLLVDTIKAWSIDDRRLNFQFGCEIGEIIQDGEIRELVKNPTYTGITYEFWRSCDASAYDDWKTMGTPGCGKGRPGQSMYVGHGSGTTRFNNVRVGEMQ